MYKTEVRMYGHKFILRCDHPPTEEEYRDFYNSAKLVENGNGGYETTGTD